MTVLLAVRLSIVVKLRSDHRRVNYKMGDTTPIYVQLCLRSQLVRS